VPFLAAEIIRALDARGLSTREPKGLRGWGIRNFHASETRKLPAFSLDKMVVILGKLDEDIEVNITFQPRRSGTQDMPHI